MRREKKASVFNTRKTKIGSYSIVAVIVVIAIVFAVNLIVGAIPSRYTKFDISSNQLFSISDETKSVVSSLDEDITLYFLSRQGTEDYTIQMLLEAYEGLSSHIRVVTKDPDIFPTFAQQFTDAAISNNSVIAASQSRSRYIDYYDLYQSDYNYGTYYETGVIEYSFVGESAVTSAIDYLLDDYVPKAYTLTGHGETALSETLKDAIASQNVETETLTLATANRIPEDAALLIINAPAGEYADPEIDMLRSYYENGGNIIYISSLDYTNSEKKLDALMAEYGVIRQPGVIIESDSSFYAWGYPYYLRPTLNYHEINTALRNNGFKVLLPLAQGLNVSETLPESVKVSNLITTSDTAYSKLAGLDITTYVKEEGDAEGPFALAAAITRAAGETQNSILWIACDALLDENVNANSSGANQDFFLNCVNWLCGKADSSLEIHSKSITSQFLSMDESQAGALSVLFIGVIPVLAVVVGIIVVVRRRRR